MSNMSPDHIDAKPSARDLVPMTNMDINMRLPVIPRIEYLFDVTKKTFKIRHFVSEFTSTWTWGPDNSRVVNNPALLHTYHHPAISFLDDPPHSEFASIDV